MYVCADLALHVPVQSVWCKQVLVEPMDLLPSLFGQSLEQLSPPMSQCLHAEVQGHSSPMLLLELRQVSLALCAYMHAHVSYVRTCMHMYHMYVHACTCIICTSLDRLP